MISQRRPTQDEAWALLVLALGAALAVFNLLTPRDRPFPGLLIVLPLIAAARCRPSTTAWVGIAALVGTVGLILRQFGAVHADQATRLISVVAAGAIAVALASGRSRAERSLRTAYEISEAAHSAPNLDALYGAIHGVVQQLMPAPNFYIALRDPGSELVTFPYWVSEKDPRPEPRTLKQGLTESVLRSGLPLHWNAAARRGRPELQAVLSHGTPAVDWLGAP